MNSFSMPITCYSAIIRLKPTLPPDTTGLRRYTFNNLSVVHFMQLILDLITT